MSTHRDITQMAPRELVRGFMHGDRPSFKLGYSWENAALAAAKASRVRGDDEPAALVAYSRGFAAGMKGEGFASNPYEPDETSGAYADGFNDGQDTDMERTYPA